MTLPGLQISADIRAETLRAVAPLIVVSNRIHIARLRDDTGASVLCGMTFDEYAVYEEAQHWQAVECETCSLRAGEA